MNQAEENLSRINRSDLITSNGRRHFRRRLWRSSIRSFFGLVWFIRIHFHRTWFRQFPHFERKPQVQHSSKKKRWFRYLLTTSEGFVKHTHLGASSRDANFSAVVLFDLETTTSMDLYWGRGICVMIVVLIYYFKHPLYLRTKNERTLLH